jgi:enoyl-[acyl-carrier protein] reductase II
MNECRRNMTINTNITKMLGIKHPIVAAPMAPFHTTELTVAVSEAGGLGVLSQLGLLDEKDPVKEMKKNMEYVVEYTDKNFGFNARTSRLEPFADALCSEIPKFILENQRIREQCVYALTSAGSAKTLPRSKSFQELRKTSQIKHFHVAPALWLAEKCIAAGVDGLVVTGTEGGGHQSYEKVSTLVLLQSVLQNFPDIPRIACGGFATGEGLAAALSLGAGAIAMGSRFIASTECEFHDTYKKVIPPAKAQDTVLVTGVLGPIRLWKNDYSLRTHSGLVANKEEKMATESAKTTEELAEAARAYDLAYQGNVNDGAVLLGQSIGLIDDIESVSTIINKIIKDAEKAVGNAVNQIK